MKRLLLTGILIILSLAVIAQKNTFKAVTKKQNGNVPSSAGYRLINGNVSKGGQQKNYNLSGNIRFPVINRENDGIRKIISRNNSPVFIEKITSGTKSSSSLSPEERFYAFFEDEKLTTKIPNPGESFIITDISKDELGITHVSAVQQYKGVKIYGSESSLHLSPGKEIFTGRLHQTDQEINTKPVHNANEIRSVVVRDIKKITAFRELSAKEKEFLKYESPACNLIIMKQEDNSYALAYQVEIRPNFLEVWRYFVDANTGKILRKYNITCSDGPATASATDLNGVSRVINTYLEGTSYLLVDASEGMYIPATQEGVIMTLNANNTSTTNLDYNLFSSATNTWNVPSAVSAHYNAATTYKYFNTKFGRNSINGNGGNIISFVNVAEQGGSSMDNAFWNGYAVFYGNGATNFKPLAGGLDVTAHELGHGVVSNSANLEYQGQSGAINETFADIFGSMVDREDWLLGEDITQPLYSPSGALRNMADPHNMGTNLNDHYWQPKHVSEMYLGEGDNGGVHINSGIGNYAYYLYATALSKDKAELVFYDALTKYLKSTSQFIDFRIAVTQAAKIRYGDSSVEAAKAAEAFDAVGIYEEEQVNSAQDYPVNPGQEYLLSFDTYVDDPNSLYRSSVTGTNFVALTTTNMKGKVSVTDAGSVAVFVSADGQIKAINTDPQNPNERTISSVAQWDNVAISKDGKRLAAISIYIDTAIYVFDLESNTGVKFHLYNPTTSQTETNAGGVLYADAIEFDHTGEYLIYDSYNVLSSTTTDDIYYWDIGFINVWDNSLGDYGSGTISKLFSSLPENVSVGNPVFSKNSPYIIAFDYFDSYNDKYAILGANLLTNDLKTIADNSIIGYPSYSKDDNKIAYSALNNLSGNIVAVRSLNADKISGSGTPAEVVPDAKWPVFYATGFRYLGLKPVTNFTVDIKEGAAPLEVQFIDLSINDPTSWSWTFTGGTPSTSASQNPVVVYNNPGTYAVTLTATNISGNDTKLKDAYIIVTTGTGVDDPKGSDIGFYPNPVTDIVKISCETDFIVRISNIQGALLFRYENTNEFDLSRLDAGIYIIEIRTANNIVRKKLIKN